MGHLILIYGYKIYGYKIYGSTATKTFYKNMTTCEANLTN